MSTPRGLRRNLLWTIAGNGIYGASQWATLSLIAKLGSTEMLGRYALAVAIATPPMMLSHLNLRAVLATDANREHRFADYVAVRRTVSAFAFLVVMSLSLTSTSPLLTILVGISLTAENQSDLYFGSLQRNERMDAIALSMMLRGAMSIIAVATGLALTRSVIGAAAALACGRIVLLYVYDRPITIRGQTERPSGRHSQWHILRKALPLGAVLMLVSLTTNIPRYAIERRLGTESLGVFAAIASFVAIGHIVINALGQSITPRLASLYSARKLRGFLRLAVAAVLTGAAVGLAAVGLSLVAGSAALRLLYRPEYADFLPVLIAMTAASIVAYTASVLGYVNTSARSFDAQLPVIAVSASVCAVASEILVGRYGLPGAPMALGAAAGAQILGHVLILRRSLRRAAK